MSCLISSSLSPCAPILMVSFTIELASSFVRYCCRLLRICILYDLGRIYLRSRPSFLLHFSYKMSVFFDTIWNRVVHVLASLVIDLAGKHEIMSLPTSEKIRRASSRLCCCAGPMGSAEIVVDP